MIVRVYVDDLSRLRISTAIKLVAQPVLTFESCNAEYMLHRVVHK